MDSKYIELIKKYNSKNMSVAGITSMLYMKGFKGLKYMELRKAVFKELQRIDSFQKVNK